MDREWAWRWSGRLALAGLLLIAGGCREQQGAGNTKVRPVKTELVGSSGRGTARTLLGRAEAAREAELAFQVPGLLALLPVKAGDKVAKGDVIAELRTDEYQARLASLKGQLEGARIVLRALREGERPEERLRLDTRVRAAQAKVENAKAQFDRYAELIKSNAIALKEYEIGETNYRVAQEELKAAIQTREMSQVARQEDIEAKEAEVAGLEGRVREATIQLEDCTLRAPFDGVIARRFVEANQSINARQPIVRLQSAGDIYVGVDVPEAIMASNIRSANIAQMTAEFPAAPGKQFPVQIAEVQQVADPATQTFHVLFTVKAPPELMLLPGMTAKVQMPDSIAAGAKATIPVSALYREGAGETVVWVIGQDLTARRRPVKTGEAMGERIVILEGVKEGDRIAVAGVSFLSDGQKVRDLGNALGGGSK